MVDLVGENLIGLDHVANEERWDEVVLVARLPVPRQNEEAV